MSSSLKGKTALVTGSSRGIGRAIAQRLAADGAAVVINYARNRPLAQAVVDGIVARSGKAFAIQADISSPPEVQRLFDEAAKATGPLDIVVANAALVLEKPLVDSTEEDSTPYSTSIRKVYSSRFKKPLAVSGRVAALLPFQRAAQSCISPTSHFISGAKGPSSNLLVPCRSNSVRAMLR